MVVVPLLLDDEVQRLVDEAVASQEGIRHRILRDSQLKNTAFCAVLSRKYLCKTPHSGDGLLPFSWKILSFFFLLKDYRSLRFPTQWTQLYSSR